MTINNLAVGNFRLRQREIEPADTINRSYDLIIAGLSWEDRSTFGLSQLTPPSAEVTLLKFKSRSEIIDNLKTSHLAQFRSFCNKITIKELNSSVDTQNNFKEIKSWLHDAHARVGRPLSLLIDVTCIPKTYVLYILGLAFSEEIVSRMDCIYAPGEYDLVGNGGVEAAPLSGPRAILSEGEWFSRQIPYLEAVEYIANDRDIIVTLGGELGLTLPFIERHEPRRLGVICISETAPSGETPILPSEMMAYKELLREPNAEHTNLPLCDAIAVAAHSLQFAQNSQARGITGLAIGSKPHALGLGLAALSYPNMEIVCRTPAAYRPVNVPASGKLMFYEIEDRFDPRSYLIDV